MKIAIVDDAALAIHFMKEVAQAQGHEVMGISIRMAIDMFRDVHLDYYTDELDEMVSAIQTFNPDWVFLDHDLNISRPNGRDLANALGFPADKLVCISGNRRDYCAWYFGEKDSMKYEWAQKEFLQFLESLQA